MAEVGFNLLTQPTRLSVNSPPCASQSVVACAREPGEDAFAGIEVATGGFDRNRERRLMETDMSGQVRMASQLRPLTISTKLLCVTVYFAPHISNNVLRWFLF
jgi:hypothetical protein